MIAATTAPELLVACFYDGWAQAELWELLCDGFSG